MHGSLALARGTLFLGFQAKTAQVIAFDLGGRQLSARWTFRDAQRGRSAVAGLAVDEDRRVWVADTPCDRVRVFSVFGREVGGIGEGYAERKGEGAVLPGLVSAPVDVDVQGHGDEGSVVIACAGERRHAVQLFEPDGTLRRSCAALGEPMRPFLGVRRVALTGERLLVAESGRRSVQVFRAGEFHAAFHVTTRGSGRFEPSALAALPDGRVVLGIRAPESALLLLDKNGRLIRTLARGGEDEGQVDEPCDAVCEPGADDRHARLFVLDRDGLRIQAFTLEGRCLGSIPFEPGIPRRPPEARESLGGAEEV